MVERPGNDDIHKAFRLFDQGQKGKVDFDDLKQIATQASSKWVKSAYIGLEGGSIAELCSALAVAVMPLYLLTCWSLTAAQIGEQITDDEMREMVAEADRSGTGRVGAHVEGPRRLGGATAPARGYSGAALALRKHAPPLRRQRQPMASLISRLSTSRWGPTTSCTS